MDSLDAQQAERARARGRWPGRLSDLSQDTSEFVAGATPAERMAMVWRLTLDAWAMAGKKIPDYPRSEAPGRLTRLADLP